MHGQLLEKTVLTPLRKQYLMILSNVKQGYEHGSTRIATSKNS